MTKFNPSIHGFHFANEFENKFIDKTIFGKQFKVSTDGRCGGMAFAALDYYFSTMMPIPSYTSNDFQSSGRVPPDGHPLEVYINGTDS